MIKANLSKHNGKYSISITGHANYAPHGSDIVCAGVSTLMHAVLTQSLEMGANVTVRSNLTEICFEVDKNTMNKDDYHLIKLWEMVRNTLKDMEEQYPENVMLILSEE